MLLFITQKQHFLHLQLATLGPPKQFQLPADLESLSPEAASEKKSSITEFLLTGLTCAFAADKKLQIYGLVCLNQGWKSSCEE